MCEESAPAPQGMSRRRVPLPPRALSVAGLTAYPMAMHLPAPTSEGAGSMRSHLDQAAANGSDVAWFTEHDWRRRRLLYRPSYHFLAEDLTYGAPWTTVELANAGSLTSTSIGQLVRFPISPFDPTTSKGSLRLQATSTGTTAATLRYRVNSDPSRMNMIARITGRVVSIDVLPNAVGPNAWGEVRVALSRQPAAVNRPAGIISMVDVIHSQGGLASINHPFTSGDTGGLTTAGALAGDLLAIGAGRRPGDPGGRRPLRGPRPDRQQRSRRHAELDRSEHVGPAGRGHVAGLLRPAAGARRRGDRDRFRPAGLVAQFRPGTVPLARQTTA